MLNPLASCRFRTRADVQDAVRALVDPLAQRSSPGNARVRLGHTAAHFGPGPAELEGFARPLWGLVPLAAGGGQWEGWGSYLRGLVSGTDPDSAEYWGDLHDRDQRMVEMAAVGFALALVPDLVWQPLPPRARARLTDWLLQVNRHEPVDNNWLFFRVLVNLGLANVGAEHDPRLMHSALDRLESFHIGDGWYADGPRGRRDYYVPWAFHVYGLIYARLAGAYDPQRADRMRERAAAFAHDHVHWFAADGSAIPFGRSLTYRFAQAAFWGALGFADVPALPWGVVKGLALRNLRWWAQPSIFQPDGTLSIGYAYPNLLMAESYNSPGSPYWAMKAFLPLALAADHPFWTSAEEPLPELPAVHEQPQAGLVISRDRSGGHVVALAAGQVAPGLRHGAEKYGKFAYSTRFGFSVPASTRSLAQVAPDSMLALTDDDTHYRVREDILETGRDRGALWSRWRAWPDVDVETWLLPAPPWHVRVHRIRTGRRLQSAEGGFAVDRLTPGAGTTDQAGPGFVLVRGRAGIAGVRDLSGERAGEALRPEPNTNLLMPLTSLGVLHGVHEPGEHWLATAVLAEADPSAGMRAWQDGPPAPPAWYAEVR